MTLPVPTLDHVVINARDDMDRAADIYRRLGFTLTERGYHSLGSTNHLAMFGTDYLELIAVPKNATSGRLDLLNYAYGLNGLVFGSEDSAITYAALTKAGLPFDPPSEFTRPVKYTGGQGDARFRTIDKCRFMVATASSGGRGRKWDVADLVIYYSSTNNLEHRDQSQERAKDMTKKRSTAYVDLIPRREAGGAACIFVDRKTRATRTGIPDPQAGTRCARQ